MTHHWVVALDDAELGVWFLRGHEGITDSALARVQSRADADWTFLLDYLRTLELLDQKADFRFPTRPLGKRFVR